MLKKILNRTIHNNKPYSVEEEEIPDDIRTKVIGNILKHMSDDYKIYKNVPKE